MVATSHRPALGTLKKLVVLLACLLTTGVVVLVVLRAVLARDGEVAPQVHREDVREAQTQAHLAALAVYRVTALAALRLRVPVSEVPDEEVRLIYWEPIRWEEPANAIHWDPNKAGFAGGYWLGKARAVALTWESRANELVPLRSLWGQYPGAPESAALPFYDVRATDEASAKAFSLMAQRARIGTSAVVPISLERMEGGSFKVEYFDGWDSGCGHWSSGSLRVDPLAGVVTMGGHMD